MSSFTCLDRKPLRQRFEPIGCLSFGFFGVCILCDGGVCVRPIFEPKTRMAEEYEK